MSLKDYIEAAQAKENGAISKTPVVAGAEVSPSKQKGEGKEISPFAHKNPATRDAQGRFIKGYAGGPGRGKGGFAEMIRDYTGDGAELVLHALEVMRGERIASETRYNKEGEPYDAVVSPTFGEQSAARNWLADRGFGKSVERIEVAAAMKGPEIDFDQLSLEERIELERLMVKASPLLRESNPGEVVEGEVVQGGQE